jgi:hypothetical protein
VFLAGLQLAGCASAPPVKAHHGVLVRNPAVLDQVECAARRTFAQAYWYNCPKATLRGS